MWPRWLFRGLLDTSKAHMYDANQQTAELIRLNDLIRSLACTRNHVVAYCTLSASAVAAVIAYHWWLGASARERE